MDSDEAISSKSGQGPTASNYDSVETDYDSLGRVSRGNGSLQRYFLERLAQADLLPG